MSASCGPKALFTAAQDEYPHDHSLSDKGRSRTVLPMPDGYDLQCAIRQRTLEFERIFRRRREPEVGLLRRAQQHRHGLRMDRRHLGVRIRGQERVEQVLAPDGRGLGGLVAPDGTRLRCPPARPEGPRRNLGQLSRDPWIPLRGQAMVELSSFCRAELFSLEAITQMAMEQVQGPPSSSTPLERDARLASTDHKVAPSELALGVIIGRAAENFDFFVFAIASGICSTRSEDGLAL